MFVNESVSIYIENTLKVIAGITRNQKMCLFCLLVLGSIKLQGSHFISWMKIKFTANTGNRFGFISINGIDIGNVLLTPIDSGKSLYTIENYVLPASEKMLRIAGIINGKRGKEGDISIEVIPPIGFKKPPIFNEPYFFSNGGKYVFVVKIVIESLRKNRDFQEKRVSG